jgi:hypothetical protein
LTRRKHIIGVKARFPGVAREPAGDRREFYSFFINH